MPIGKFVSMGVYVDDKKLPEYQIKDKIYTEVDLHGPTSYTIEEDEQKYPVLPFEIDLLLTAPFVVWTTVYVDGQVVSSRPLKKTLRVDGVKVGDEIRELLFCLPRIVEDQEQQNPLGDYAGTVRVVVKRALCTGQKYLAVFKRHTPLHANPTNQKPMLHHLTKKDVQRAKEHAVGGVVSREGRPTLGLTKTNKVRRAMNFSPTGDVLEEMVLYYRPRISSCVPKPINSNPIQKATKELQYQSQTNGERRPLVDVGNVPLQPPSTKNVADENPSLSSQEVCSQLMFPAEIKRRDSSVSSATAVDAAGKEQWLSAAGIKRRESCAADEIPPPNTRAHKNLASGFPEDVGPTNQGEHQESGMIPLDQIKRRESGIIPADQIKRRQSGMIPTDQITCQESGVIPTDQINQQESRMISTDQIKRRESELHLMDEIKLKHQEGSLKLIPPSKIKSRESCLPRDPSDGEDSEKTSETGEELHMIREGSDESIIIIDNTDDEGDDIYVVNFEDDSIVCMGDDDCYVMDVSNNMSLIDLDDTVDSMDQLDLD